MTSAEVLTMLNERCNGKHAALAHEAGVSEAYVCRVFKGDYPPSAKLLRLIGCRRVTAYEVSASDSRLLREAAKPNVDSGSPRRAKAAVPCEDTAIAQPLPSCGNHPNHGAIKRLGAWT